MHLYLGIKSFANLFIYQLYTYHNFRITSNHSDLGDNLICPIVWFTYIQPAASNPELQ